MSSVKLRTCPQFILHQAMKHSRVNLFDELNTYAYGSDIREVCCWGRFKELAKPVVLEVFHASQFNTVSVHFSLLDVICPLKCEELLAMMIGMIDCLTIGVQMGYL